MPQAAAQCREAWRLLHQWRIRPGSGNEDAQAFSRWAAEYEKKTAGEIDAARLPDLMAQHLGSLKKPKLLVAYAFDVMPPQTQRVLSSVRARRSACPSRSPASCLRTSYPSAEARDRSGGEVGARAAGGGQARASASWCPISASDRREVVRVFSRVMQPGYNLPGAGEDADAVQRLARQAAASAIRWWIPRSASSSSRSAAWNSTRRATSSARRSSAAPTASSRAAHRSTRGCARTLDATVSLPKLIAAAEPAPLLRKHARAGVRDHQDPSASRPPNGRGISPRCSRPPASPASARSTRTSSRRAPSGTRRSASSRGWSASREHFSFDESFAFLQAPSAPTRCSSPSRPTRRSRSSACSSRRACASTACG